MFRMYVSVPSASLPARWNKLIPVSGACRHIYIVHPFINARRGIIFWWSPKCGCTTAKSILLDSMVFDYVSESMFADERSVRLAIERLLVDRVGSDGGPVGRMVSDFIARSGIGSYHMPAFGAAVSIDLEEARKFRNVLFVRDPFKRFVSGVVDKHIEGYFTPKFRPESFLDAARNIRMLDRHHFCPQAASAYLPDLSYERVFDIESIDYGYLSDLLGMKVEPRVHHRNVEFSGGCPHGLSSAPYSELASMKAAGELPAHDCFYDEESRRIVADYYSGDFDLMQRWLSPSGS